MGDQIGARAIVLGGSMAGLLSARVLSEAYGEVLIVDRDRLTGVTTPRRGVPQGHHAHALLARGQQILEELFPGFLAGTTEAGVPTGDLAGDCRWFFEGRRLEPADAGLTCISATRPVLESHVRAWVTALPNVRSMEEHDIVGLATTEDGGTVTGAQVQRRAPGSVGETLDADLVVDATGRGSRMPTWLEELGYSRPEEDRVRIDLTYTSRLYKLGPVGKELYKGVLAIIPVSTPGSPRGGFLNRLQDGVCVLSLTGVLGDAAPTDPDGFLDFVASLPVPDIYQVIQDAVPLTNPVSFKYPASQWRHYERLKRFPERLLVIGDAMCSFNPVYGQGMTVASLEALVLRQHLAGGVPPRARAYFKDLAKVLATPWDMSVGSDLAFSEVEGRRTMKVRMGNAYMPKLQAAATLDSSFTRAFMRVAGLVDPPQTLMRPGMVWRVMRKARRAAPPTAEPAILSSSGGSEQDLAA